MEIPEASSLRKGVDRISKNNKIYNVVLDRCVQQIIHTSNTSNKTYTIFTVPTFLLGVVLYSTSNCILYIIEELSRKNYIVKLIEPNYIHIDWGKRINFNKNSDYIKKLLEKNPDAKIEFVYE
jgi:hypothetical protein